MNKNNNNITHNINSDGRNIYLVNGSIFNNYNMAEKFRNKIKLSKEEKLIENKINKLYSIVNNNNIVKDLLYPLDFIGNRIIINSILSRFGDLKEKNLKIVYNKHYYYNNKNSKNLLLKHIDLQYNFFINILNFLEIKYNFENVIFYPSIRDCIIVDFKLDYMDILLNNNLCDDSSILLYFDIKNNKEYMEKEVLKLLKM